MDLQTIKKHIRIDHDFEDDVLEAYIEWAKAEIKDSVSTSDNRNETYFENNVHFERAVVLLAGHYFEHRLPVSESTFYNLPHGITSAVHKLRGGYHEGE